MSIKAIRERKFVESVLIYSHCDIWWFLEFGAACPMEHDIPICDYRERRGRKRRAWICNSGGGIVAYFSYKEFLDHDEEKCTNYP